jgi:chemotaxis protein methyltransferase CheR
MPVMQDHIRTEINRYFDDFTPANFARFAAFITSELGIKMPASKIEMVRSRLLRRVRDLKMASMDEYADFFFASRNAAEREQFVNAITTNKTDFFRENAHFDFLSKVILPNYIAGTPKHRDTFRVWSAGCSSGEEAYTVAMLLAEFGSLHIGFDFAVVGTDISTRVLGKATQAVYLESQVGPVPPTLRNKYLLRGQGRSTGLVRIAPELRRKVTFQALNFMDEDYRMTNLFDVVFFRNVMIYFDKATQEQVLKRICRNLAAGGFLLAGHSESLAGLDVPLKCVKTAVYRKFTNPTGTGGSI